MLQKALHVRRADGISATASSSADTHIGSSDNELVFLSGVGHRAAVHWTSMQVQYRLHSQSATANVSMLAAPWHLATRVYASTAAHGGTRGVTRGPWGLQVEPSLPFPYPLSPFRSLPPSHPFIPLRILSVPPFPLPSYSQPFPVNVQAIRVPVNRHWATLSFAETKVSSFRLRPKVWPEIQLICKTWSNAKLLFRSQTLASD